MATAKIASVREQSMMNGASRCNIPGSQPAARQRCMSARTSSRPASGKARRSMADTSAETSGRTAMRLLMRKKWQNRCGKCQEVVPSRRKIRYEGLEIRELGDARMDEGCREHARLQGSAVKGIELLGDGGAGRGGHASKVLV